MTKKPDKSTDKTKTSAAQQIVTSLDSLCADDKEACEVLSYMFLDPRKLDVSMDDAAQQAGKAEKTKDTINARKWYEVAGGLALYMGDTEKVNEYYSEAKRVSGVDYSILRNPDKAVAKAQEYYKKYLQEEK
jgi:hypothetical protein